MERFAFHEAKVRIISLYHLCHGEIAASDEDHVAEMGIVDGGTIGVTH